MTRSRHKIAITLVINGLSEEAILSFQDTQSSFHANILHCPGTVPTCVNSSLKGSQFIRISKNCSSQPVLSKTMPNCSSWKTNYQIGKPKAQPERSLGEILPTSHWPRGPNGWITKFLLKRTSPCIIIRESHPGTNVRRVIISRRIGAELPASFQPAENFDLTTVLHFEPVDPWGLDVPRGVEDSVAT